MTEIKVPTLGESVTEATVATWFKSPGDTVAIDEMLCELETDKVTVEVPSTVSGTLSEIIAKEGDTVGLDAILGIVSEGEFVKTKTEKSGIKFESFGRFWDFRTIRVTRREVYDIESAEYQPISSHMDPNG